MIGDHSPAKSQSQRSEAGSTLSIQVTQMGTKASRSPRNAVCGSIFRSARSRTRPGKPAQKLGHGEAQDQPIEGEEEAELVHSGPPAVWRKVSEVRGGGKPGLLRRAGPGLGICPLRKWTSSTWSRGLARAAESWQESGSDTCAQARAYARRGPKRSDCSGFTRARVARGRRLRRFERDGCACGQRCLRAKREAGRLLRSL